MANQMLTTKELAEILNVVPETIRRELIPEGMPHYRISLEKQGHYRFELDAVKEWLWQRQEAHETQWVYQVTTE